MPHSSNKLSSSHLILAFLLYFSLFRACNSTALMPDFDLGSESLDPTKTGFTMTGNAASDYFGYSVSSAGDINGDGYADLIVGAQHKNGNQGAAYVIYGGATNSLADITLGTTTLNPMTTGFTVKISATGQFGFSVSRAGDINNDGYDDIILGSPGYLSKGAAFVIYGGESSTFSDLDLWTTNLNPATSGFAITGNANSDQLGRSVGPAGDINGDGFDDIIIGAPNKGSNQGIVYVIYGGKKETMTNINLATTSLVPSSTGFFVKGKLAGDWFGRSGSTAGDLNKDGFDDIVIGAYGENGNQGAVYVVYGGLKSSMMNIDLGSVTLNPASTGFKLTGTLAGDRFGYSVSTAGDINNDGFADILIGAPNRNSLRGVAYVVYGKSSPSNIDLSGGSTTLDPATTGFTILGDVGSSLLGTSLNTAGDVNGDGFADIIVGAYGYGTYSGAAYVIYGGVDSSMSNLDLSLATVFDNSAKGFRVKGATVGDYLGFSVNTAGDVNNDGFDDIIVGAYKTTADQGTVYVIHGGCVPTSPGSPCAVRNFCQTCLDANSLSSPNCQSCPGDCQQYNADKSCQTCEIGYVLENSKCESCPSHCSSCLTSGSCQTCETGYILSTSGSQCDLPTSPPSTPSEPSKTKETKVEEEAGVMSAVVTMVGSAISVGRSIFLTTGLISKIVQYTRYLDLVVSDELKEIYQNWNTDLLSLNFPNSLNHLLNYKGLPFVFGRYDLDSAFLANFWFNLMIFGGGSLGFVASKGLKVMLKSNKGKFDGLLRRVTVGSVNFLIIQIYGCVDDILFYFVLDARTNRFNSNLSRTSLFSGVLFVLCGGGLIFFNFWIVKKYQQNKRKDSSLVENFNERNHYWELFYSDFNDNDFLSQSFLAFLIGRNTLASLTIATLFEYPVLQTILLTLMDIFIIIFLFIKKPFTRLQDKISQGYFEVIALIVHICTLILSIQEGSSERDLIRLSKIIVYLNTALMVGTLGFMLLDIFKTIGKKLKSWISKLNQKKNKVHPIVEEESSAGIQISPSITTQPNHLMTSNTIIAEAEQNRDKKWINLDGEKAGESQRKPSHMNDMSDSGVNLLMQNFQMTLVNGDNSMNQEIETSRFMDNNFVRGRRTLRVKRRKESEQLNLRQLEK